MIWLRLPQILLISSSYCCTYTSMNMVTSHYSHVFLHIRRIYYVSPSQKLKTKTPWSGIGTCSGASKNNCCPWLHASSWSENSNLTFIWWALALDVQKHGRYWCSLGFAWITCRNPLWDGCKIPIMRYFIYYNHNVPIMRWFIIIIINMEIWIHIFLIWITKHSVVSLKKSSELKILFKLCEYKSGML